MPKIYPFRGWQYNQQKISDLSRVITPPYDVISPEEQATYEQASPYNYVRLILNQAPGEKRYSAAAEELENWIENGILVQDSEPVLYLLSQSFSNAGQPITRLGIITAMEVVPFGQGVLAHEHTFAKTIRDRYRLLDATQANLGQIFLTYRDREMTVENLAESVMATPAFIAVVLDHVHYRLWKITNQNTVIQICSAIGASTIIVADGHHRYTTAIEYLRDHPGQPGADRVMVTLVNSFNPGMDILPTHRLVKKTALAPEKFIAVLPADFTAETVPSLEKLNQLVLESPTGLIRLGFHFSKNDQNILVSLDCTELPASVLHEQILAPFFDLDIRRPEDKDKIAYLRGADDLANLLEKAGDFDLVCLVKPPTLDQVFNIAEAGGLMPQKSTYFYPKVYSGLVLRRIE